MKTIGVVAVTAVLTSLALAAPVLAEDVKQGTGEVRRELRRDTREIRQDRRELRQDRRALYEAKESGNPEAVKAARQELRKDRRELREDVRDRRQDAREALRNK